MLKEIFTWWNGQTLGVRLWTYLNGQFVAEDQYRNRYYSNKKDSRRWVVYHGEIDASKVTPEWNNWLRFTSDHVPSEENDRYDWQLDHTPNQTGTTNAYSPKSSSFNRKKSDKDLDYEKWKPGN
ncbi:MAG: NADH-ubiquinone oxidoreductase subunit NDUFA12 family protein [Pelagibacterales bacterium]|nr:NADH-ubiquinone oxidoreductase subunit NDUFA12 family protein [Pelagibacterales bacterium]